MKAKAMVITTAVAAALVVGGCTQKTPQAGLAIMKSSSAKAKCGANKCKANKCKANSCTGSAGKK